MGGYVPGGSFLRGGNRTTGPESSSFTRYLEKRAGGMRDGGRQGEMAPESQGFL